MPSDLLTNSLHLKRNVQNILDLPGSASLHGYFRQPVLKFYFQYIHCCNFLEYKYKGCCYFCCCCRPGKPGTTATGRGVLSLSGLSHGVVRVDKEGSLTSLTLQDCGTVLPGGMLDCSHVVMFDPCLLCKPVWKMGICWAFLSHPLKDC